MISRLLLACLSLVLPILGAHLTPVPDEDFLNAASKSNLAGIQADSLARAKSSNPAIRSLSQIMIADFMAAQHALKSLARDEDIELDSVTDSEHRSIIERLASLDGAALDSAWLNALLLDHAVTQTLYKQEALGGKDAATRAYTVKILPSLNHHLALAQKITAR